MYNIIATENGHCRVQFRTVQYNALQYTRSVFIGVCLFSSVSFSIALRPGYSWGSCFIKLLIYFCQGTFTLGEGHRKEEADKRAVTMNSWVSCASIWGNLTLQGSCFFKLVSMFCLCQRNVLLLGGWRPQRWSMQEGSLGEVKLFSGVVCDITLGQVWNLIITCSALPSIT